MAEEDTQPRAAADEEESSPWGTLFWGVVLIAAGVGGYFFFDHFEREGGSARIPAVILIVYKVLGKYGVLGVFSGIGALMSFAGVKGIASKD